MALNGYFYAFIPVLLGVVAASAGIAKALSHVEGRLDTSHAWLLALGVALYLLGTTGLRVALGITPLVYRLIAAAGATTSALLGIYVSALAQLSARSPSVSR